MLVSGVCNGEKIRESTMLAAFLESIKSLSSAKTSKPAGPSTGDKRRRDSGAGCNEDGNEVVITDVLQTPPSKRLKDTDPGPSSRPKSNFEIFVKGIRTWSDKYIWRHVVAGSEAPQSDPEILSEELNEAEEEMEKYDILASRAKPCRFTTTDRTSSRLTRHPITSHDSSYRPAMQSRFLPTSTPAHITTDFEHKEEPQLWTQSDLGESYLHTDYYPDKYREKKSSDIGSTNTRPLLYEQDRYKSSTHKRTKLQKQLDNRTRHSDLQSKKFSDDSRTNDCQLRKSKLSFTIGQSSQDSSAAQGKSSTRPCRVHNGHRNRSRYKVVSTVEEVVRLEERNRYRQVLSQFTSSVSLPWTGSQDVTWDASTSSSLFDAETGDRQKTQQCTGVAEGSFLSSKSNLFPMAAPVSSSHLIKAPTVHRIVASPTKTQDRTSANVFLYSKPERRGTSIRDSTVNKSYSQSKLLDIPTSTPDPLGDDWTRKWREIVSTESLSRTREIDREERKLQAIRAKKKEEQEALKNEIRERMKKQDEEKEERDSFVALTGGMERKIDAALGPGHPEDPLVDGFRITIKRGDIATLNNLNWLNDEIMNFYFSLIMERSNEPGRCKVHAFNSFFYPKLVKSGYTTLRRWTKKVDIFAMDIVAVPVHLGMHWCLATIDFRKKCISYYDSLNGSNPQCLEALRGYLSDESLDKKKQPFDMSGWTTSSPKDIPEQLNGCDCGVFTCKYAEYITRGAPFNFDQRHMPYFRRRMVYEILTKKLL